MRKIFLVLTLMVISPIAQAGPFGVDMGDTAKSLGIEWPKDGTGVILDDLNVHPIFDTYIAYGNDESGVCAMHVVALPEEGEDINDLFDEVEGLWQAYSGLRSEDIEVLGQAPAIAGEAPQSGPTLVKRFLHQASGRPKPGSAFEGVATSVLRIAGDHSRGYWVDVFMEFENFPQCLKKEGSFTIADPSKPGKLGEA